MVARGASAGARKWLDGGEDDPGHRTVEHQRRDDAAA
jgi:hypothetical protein